MFCGVPNPTRRETTAALLSAIFTPSVSSWLNGLSALYGRQHAVGRAPPTGTVGRTGPHAAAGVLGASVAAGALGCAGVAGVWTATTRTGSSDGAMSDG